MTFKTAVRSVSSTIAFAICATASATAIDDFRSLTTDTRAARGEFSQVVADKNGKVVRQSSGSFSLARPGKFRWSYDKPFAQLLVGDGQKVWIYDRDLNQVTIRPFDQTLSSTPAALLSGSSDFEKMFAIEEQPAAGGISWLIARPRATDSGLEYARIGFAGGLLNRLEFVDAFGQKTTISVAKFEKNPALPADHFKFTPPKGADVVGG